MNNSISKKIDSTVIERLLIGVCESIEDMYIYKQLPSPGVLGLITILAGFLTRFVDQKIGFIPSHSYR